MGRISEYVATMRGCRLSEIVDAIARMEAEDLDVGTDSFEQFWTAWPHKVGKPAAKKAYAACIKRKNDHSDIMEGMATYIGTKPPERPWLNPATFLNQERFNDMPAQVYQPQPKGLAAERVKLQLEILDANRSAGQTSDYHSNAGRLAIGSRFDDERNRGRLL